MKLISCYIENFGNISRRSFDFGAGLTSVCEHNGYGKTTLAAFLKAMFYGLKPTTARDRELGERARYYPFAGGTFGGNVVFEKDGDTYKIERFFGKKSATEDTVAIYKNGARTEAEDIGKEFFGLDEQSFLRTVFITSADTESGATGDISRMLNGFVDDADYEGAVIILEKKQKELKAGRGSGGKISLVRDGIVRLRDRIENKRRISEGLGGKYSVRAEIAAAIGALEKRRSLAGDRNLALQKWSTYDGFVADAEAERAKLNAVAAKYPAGLPSAEEVKTLKSGAERLGLVKERLASTSFTDQKKQRLAELAARFLRHVPSDEEMRAANANASEAIRLGAEAANYERLSSGGAERKLPAVIPEENEVKIYGEKLAALREKNKRTPAKASKKLPLAFALAAIIVLGAGAGLLAVNAIVGGALMGVGALVAFAGIFIYFKGQINGIKGTADGGLENEIASFLVRCGYYSGGGVEVDFNNLTRDLQSAAERDNYAKLYREKRAETEAAEKAAVSFLAEYGFAGDDIQSELARLGALTAEYIGLNREKADVEARTADGRAQAQSLAATVSNILSAYAITETDDTAGIAEAVERDRSEYDRLKENTARLEARAAAFKTENALGARPSGEGEDVREIDAQLAAKREELSLLDREISDDETEAESLEKLEEELAAAQREEENLKKKYELITKTIALLERAEGSLKDRYVSPVKNSFVYYGGLLEKTLGEKVVFGKDFKVRFERNGEERSDGHLSAGQKSLCALCLRLALIDNMYKGEKPFVIMDDPFVHLDAEHLGRAKTLIKELAANKQIIYFCCHESRKIQEI